MTQHHGAVRDVEHVDVKAAVGAPQWRAPSLREIITVLDSVYPRSLAAPWDAVGLVCGDLDQDVSTVLLAVDVTDVVVEEALDARADLLLVHHPLFLRPVHGVGTDTPKGRLLHRLMRAKCALFSAHTNADTATPGVSDALARVLGLTDLAPLEPVPSPASEVMASRGGAEDASATGFGRIGTLRAPTLLRAFAEQVARALPRTMSGVRIAGPMDAVVHRVAVCGGAGDSLLDAARAAEADVFVTSDLRHHAAGESLETGRPWLIDVAHWASEWPWLLGARERLLSGLDGYGQVVDARVSATSTDPWTARL